MNEESLQLLKKLLDLPLESLTDEQKAIIKGRVAYLSAEERSRYPFLTDVATIPSLPKETFKPKIIKQAEVTDKIVTAANSMDYSEDRVKKLSNRSFLENGGADPDFSEQTKAAAIQNEQLAQAQKVQEEVVSKVQEETKVEEPKVQEVSVEKQVVEVQKEEAQADTANVQTQQVNEPTSNATRQPLGQCEGCQEYVYTEAEMNTHVCKTQEQNTNAGQA